MTENKQTKGFAELDRAVQITYMPPPQPRGCATLHESMDIEIITPKHTGVLLLMKSELDREYPSNNANVSIWNKIKNKLIYGLIKLNHGLKNMRIHTNRT